VDVLYTYNVNATDPDGDTLTYALTTKPAGMTINSTTGLINWTPTSTGYYDVTVEVSDGELSDTQSFTITVNVEAIPNLELVPYTQSVTVGNQATVIVVVENVTNLKKARISLKYNPFYLNWVLCIDGSFIPNAFWVNDFSIPAGEVILNGSCLWTVPPAPCYASGTGNIITIVFEKVAAGNTNITFGSTKLTDKDDNTITHTTGIGCSITD
jgi:hypothetical protein